MDTAWIVPRLVGEQALELAGRVRRTIPDHVIAAVPGTQIVVRTGDRIAQKLLARRQAERHGVEQFAVDRRRKCRLGNERAPGHVAGIERHHLRQTLLAHGRAQAVGTDQKIALDRVGVRELDGHRILGRRETPHAAAAVIMPRGNASRNAR